MRILLLYLSGFASPLALAQTHPLSGKSDTQVQLNNLDSKNSLLLEQQLYQNLLNTQPLTLVQANLLIRAFEKNKKLSKYHPSSKQELWAHELNRKVYLQKISDLLTQKVGKFQLSRKQKDEILVQLHGQIGFYPKTMDTKKFFNTGSAHVTPTEPSKFDHLQDWIGKKEVYQEASIDQKSKIPFVMVNGQRMESGDIVLMNTSLHSDGVFSALANDRQSYSHAGMIVFQNESGKWIPTFVEAYKGGVRSLPLASLFDKKFASSIEIYRNQNKSADIAEVNKLDRVTRDLLTKNPSYNLTGQKIMDTNESVICSTVVDHIYNGVWSQHVRPESDLQNHVYNAVAAKGFKDRTFLSSNDIALHKNQSKVASFEFENLDLKLTVEVIKVLMNEKFKEGPFSLDKMPWDMDVVSGVIKRARDPHSLTSKVVDTMASIPSSKIPKGSEQVVAWAMFVEKQYTRAVDNCLRGTGPATPAKQRGMQSPTLSEIKLGRAARACKAFVEQWKAKDPFEAEAFKKSIVENKDNFASLFSGLDQLFE